MKKHCILAQKLVYCKNVYSVNYYANTVKWLSGNTFSLVFRQSENISKGSAYLGSGIF